MLEWSQFPDLPDTIGVAAPFAGVSGGQLVVAGGANFPEGAPWEGGPKIWHDSIYTLAHPEGEWNEAGTLPHPLAYGVSITTPQGVLCIGGSDADRHYADVFLLRLSDEGVEIEWLPALPRPMADGCGALLGNTVYVAGGAEAPGATSAMRTFWALDLDAPSLYWRELEPWPGPERILPLAAVQDGAFFVVSGVELYADPEGRPARRYLQDAYRFKPGAGWSQTADLPHPAAAAPSPAPALGQSHFLVLAGDDGSKLGFQPVRQHPGFAKGILAYHTITDTWTPLGEVPSASVTVPLVRWRGGFVIPSGEVRPGVRSPAVWSFEVTGARAGFGWLNYTTLVLYLAGVVWLGASFTRRNKTTNDFFRGGQRIPWWAAGLSIFATMLSSITFMAIPAMAYSSGWNFFLANSYLLLTPLVVAVYLPFYRSLNVTSAYDYLERRFNTATRLVASTLFILFQLGRIAIVLYLPALALSTVSTLDVTTCILAMGVLCIIYTALGGMEAVIWTDAAQAVVLVGGAIWALIAVISHLEGGVGAAIETAAAHGKFFETVPWRLDYTIAAAWTILIGSIFTNLFPYTASQDVVQRYLTTADEKGAGRAIWTNAFVSPMAQAIFFAIGTALFVFYRQHPERLDPTLRNDAIFPLFIVHELPVGVAGVLIAAIFAAAQSTLGSSLNSVATAYVTDFHRRFRPRASDRSCLTLARWLTVAVGLVGTGAALVLAKSDVRSLWETFLAVIGLFGGTVSGLFALGIFSARATGRGALIGALVSALLVFSVRQFTDAHFFCYAIVGVLSCIAVGVVASLVTPGPRHDITGLTVYSRKRDRHSSAQSDIHSIST